MWSGMIVFCNPKQDAWRQFVWPCLVNRLISSNRNDEGHGVGLVKWFSTRHKNCIKSREFKHAWYGRQIAKFTECWRIFHTFSSNFREVGKVTRNPKTNKIAYQLHEREPVMLETLQFGVYETAKPLEGEENTPIFSQISWEGYHRNPPKNRLRDLKVNDKSSKVWCSMIWRSNIGTKLRNADPYY